MKSIFSTFMLLILLLTFPLDMNSQSIQLDSLFSNSAEFFPFEGIENISSLSMEATVVLNHDTSLVRIILEDETGYQYMISESYPLICESLQISYYDHCDETCFLEQVNPYAIIVQVIDATIYLKSLQYTTEAKQNAEEQRYAAKRSQDTTKILTLNQRIPVFNMDWTAGDNNTVSKYYEQKKEIFGDAYNLSGYEYYSGGVFEFLGHRNYPKADPALTWRFDWRDRHGANDPLSGYWDSCSNNTGWMTEEKGQFDCGACWAFSSVGVTEAIINLFTAQSLDFDLSEQDLLCNDNSALGCSGSFNDFSGLIYIKDSGVVSEDCFPYNLVSYDDSCQIILPCSNPDPVIKIFDTLVLNTENELDVDNIRKTLISRGPLKLSFPVSKGEHAVALTGYEFNIKDSSITWIIKNSTETGYFEEIKLEAINYAIAAIPPVYKNDTILPVRCQDLDLDQYYFWGIGDKPEDCDCDTIEDCDDNNPFVGGYDENYNCSCILEMDPVSHHIASDTSWVDSILVNYEVIIDSGACLTIESYAAFAPEARITVSPGGKLILDGAYLTKVCPELWQGINVLGTDTMQCYDEYFGKVVVQNNSVIEFARVGIANCCTMQGNFGMNSGGIISVDSSIFRDNETGILLSAYSTYWFGHDLPYNCGIIDSRFITTNNLYPDHVPKAHIDLTDIYGIIISACIFENLSDTSDFPYPIRGTGIFSVDSHFWLEKQCKLPMTPCQEYDSCRFSLLEYGIKAMNSRSKRTLNIQEVIFYKNLLAISLSGLEYASVLSNNIECPKIMSKVPEERFKGGLFMEGCTGYHVENNFIHGPLNPWINPSPASGIGVKNSGPENNEIYNNVFQKVTTGIISIGENRGQESGLCLKCNDNIGNVNDFLVIEDDSLHNGIQGINHYQGDPVDSTTWSAPAGNIFTKDLADPDSIAIINYNFFNDAEDLLYTHHYHENKQVRPKTNNYTSSTIILKVWLNLQYEKETACPSGLVGGGNLKSLSSSRSKISEADFQLNILKDQLDLLVDAGNTEALNNDVLTSLPEEGLEIRQELLDASPYLSDTVLKQAIYKEDVLPNAMVRDILEANPQSAKSDEIIMTLDSRFEPMPDYMIAQIMEGKKYLGAKEVLEAKIQSWEQIRSKAKADLMREFLLDTNMIRPLDSVISFLANETDLDSKYDLALAQWDDSNVFESWVTLNSIPLQFNLNESQNTNYQNYLEYFAILQTLADSNWTANQLDSASVSLLFELKESGCPKIAALSRGLLVKGGWYNYIEEVYLLDLKKNTRNYYNKYPIQTTNIQEETIWLFPNPAGDYAIAYYNLESKYKTGDLQLVDMKGKLLSNYHIRSGKDQVVIDLKEYPNGLYVISLKTRNSVIDSKKLIKGGK